MITIDTQTRFQTIEGFGASGSWSIDPVGEYWAAESRERLAELLFSVDEGIGLSAWKFSAGTTGVESLALIFYSPPGWMTRNGLTHPDADSGTSNLAPQRLTDFVTRMGDVGEHLESAHGVRFTDIVPLNEPNWAWNDSIQEANRYAVADIKAIVIALGAELSARGSGARITTPEAGEIMALLDDESFREYWFGVQRRYNSQNLELSTGGKYREYAKEILGDPDLRPFIRNAISAHSYWSDYSNTADDRLVRLREMVRADLDRHAPDARYLQTEYCILGDRGPGRDLTMKSALEVARVVHHDLTILNAVEWSWWLALSPHDYKDGLLYTDWQRPGDDENLITSRILWVLGQYSRFIRPGYVRVAIGIDSAPAEVLPSAWVSPDGERLVLVLANTGATAVEVSLPADRAFGLHRTSADEELLFVGGVRPGDTLVLPSESVTTLVAEEDR